MPTARSLLAALALTFAVGACDRDAPTSPPAAPGVDNQSPPTAPKLQKLVFGLQDADQTEVINDVTYTFASVQVTKLEYENGKLLVTGAVLDPAGNVISTFTRDEATLKKVGPPTAPVCQILELDLGPVFLDLLGLQVDLDPVHLEINAVSGPGNLLGNLLCALVGLLDPGPGNLDAITQLLTQINALLSQILGLLG
jgi:hypothetical protein